MERRRGRSKTIDPPKTTRKELESAINSFLKKGGRIKKIKTVDTFEETRIFNQLDDLK